MSLDRLKIPRPDDWHVHVREGAILRAVLPFTARHFGRALVMPNLKTPVTTTAHAKTYRDEIMAALPRGTAFRPLMTLYLTDETEPDDLERGHREGFITAAKLYPAHATTNSGLGVTDLQALAPVLERMQRCDIPLSVHGEVVDPAVDIFDRESVFIDRVLVPLRRNFPALKIVLEHVTSLYGVDYVLAEGQDGLLAATITAHHLRLNRNAMFVGGLRPHFYCLPVAKRERDRKALVAAATSGGRMFFLGTDSAPHPRTAKEKDYASGGIFTSINALEIYAHVFSEQGALDHLASFASQNGPAFYGLPVNTEILELEPVSAESGSAPLKPILTSEGAEIIPFQDVQPLAWRVFEQEAP
ncbi:MAG: dihydroorotase [Alphaproteobacteria bacterium]|nr:dihydroorotase [Alphaproteobacteria bacterium]